MFSACTPECCFFLQSCWNVQWRGFTVSNWGALQHKIRESYCSKAAGTRGHGMGTGDLSKHLEFTKSFWEFCDAWNWKSSSRTCSLCSCRSFPRSPERAGMGWGWAGIGLSPDSEAHRHYLCSSGGRGSGSTIHCCSSLPTAEQGCPLPAMCPWFYIQDCFEGFPSGSAGTRCSWRRYAPQIWDYVPLDSTACETVHAYLIAITREIRGPGMAGCASLTTKFFELA